MSETLKPIVVDLGKQNRKKLKKLKHGEGPLLDEVLESVAQVSAQLGADAQGRVILPVVVMYEKKDKGGKMFGMLPFKV